MACKLFFLNKITFHSDKTYSMCTCIGNIELLKSFFFFHLSSQSARHQTAARRCFRWRSCCSALRTAPSGTASGPSRTPLTSFCARWPPPWPPSSTASSYVIERLLYCAYALEMCLFMFLCLCMDTCLNMQRPFRQPRCSVPAIPSSLLRTSSSSSA